VLQAVHQEVPGGEVAAPGYTILPAPPETAAQTPAGGPQPGASATDADRLRAIYKDVGVEQKHTYGEGPPGTKPPDFTRIPSVHGVPPPNAASQLPASQAQPAQAHAAQAQPAQSPPSQAQPAQAQPAQARTIPPKPPVPVVAKPKPQPPASADETDQEPASAAAPAAQPAGQPAAPAARKPAPPVVMRPHLPVATPATNPTPANQ
jgi:hypothetical protein